MHLCVLESLREQTILDNDVKDLEKTQYFFDMLALIVLTF